MKNIPIVEDDNEDHYMEDNNYNNKHQLMENQNINHHFDKVVKHIEIQLEKLLYLLKQHKNIQIKFFFQFSLLVLFTHPPPTLYLTSVPDGHNWGIIWIADTQYM
jgi:hypothetical protein